MAASLLIGIVITLTAAWGALALWIRAPLPRAGRGALTLAWLASALAAIAALAWPAWKPAGYVFAVAVIALLLWWHTLRPSNNRDWIPEVARQTHGEVDGNQVTLHNVRNFDWRTRTDFTPHWETRRYALDELQSVDVALSYWNRPAIAHALVSFGFGHDRYVVFSVEIRRKQGDRFSEIGGFFKQYELSVIASTEEDSLRVRTNVRGEDGYLYRVHMPLEAARSLFLAYVDSANRLRDTPRFYHTLTANCTTIVFQMARRIVPGLPLDLRQLASGYLPEYLYDLQVLRGANNAGQYRRLGRYTERARANATRATFSRDIRHGLPGIDAL
ncbi:Lnb N-terminal periplasmic domain-containing protein [Achromobacter marplatensis]|uniref:Lnb N-terminal periplasmic domain-containing protein n=1 Tax=Achromobacter marplatensis TaxID=470868 RepID=UPI0039F6F9CC